MRRRAPGMSALYHRKTMVLLATHFWQCVSVRSPPEGCDEDEYATQTGWRPQPVNQWKITVCYWDHCRKSNWAAEAHLWGFVSVTPYDHPCCIIWDSSPVQVMLTSSKGEENDLQTCFEGLLSTLLWTSNWSFFNNLLFFSGHPKNKLGVTKISCLNPQGLILY